MTNMYRLLLIGVIFFSSCTPQIQSYFPVNENKTYHYSSTFNGVTYEEEIVTKTVEIEGLDAPAFYFIRTYDVNKVDAIIGKTMFGSGLYYYGEEGLMIARVYWKGDIPKITKKDFHLVIPTKAKKGYISTVPNGEGELQFEVFGRKKVDVEDKQYLNCLAIQIREVWPDVIHKGGIWLAKKKGVVKWVKTTGRIDYYKNKKKRRNNALTQK